MLAFAPRFTITNAITAALTTIERARGFLDAATLSEEWVEGMTRVPCYSKHTTPRISGARSSPSMKQRACGQAKTCRAPTPTTYASCSTTGTRSTWWLSTSAAASLLPEGLIREIHKRLVKGVRGGTAQPGEYRELQNYVAR